MSIYFLLQNSPVALAGLVTTLRALVWDQTWETSTPLAVRQVLDVVQELSLHSEIRQKNHQTQCSTDFKCGDTFNEKVTHFSFTIAAKREMIGHIN